jgi:antitoxin component YwqK of YwqJK toxin-antitoxin module
MCRNNTFILALVFYLLITIISCEMPGKEPNGNLNPNGLRDGVWIEYYDEGNILRKSNYKNGLKDGEEVTYHKNGKINSIATYYTGFLHGKWTKWHQNGDLDEQGEYMGGKAEGHWIYYFYDKNKKRQEGFYKQSIRDSTWTDYLENGNITQQLLYRDGRIVPKVKK